MGGLQCGGNNPSVNYVDSSLYTREPLVGGLGICGASKFLVSAARFFTALRFVLNDNEGELKRTHLSIPLTHSLQGEGWGQGGNLESGKIDFR